MNNPFKNFDQTQWEIFSDLMAVCLIVCVIFLGLSWNDPEHNSWPYILMAPCYLILKAYSYSQAKKLQDHSWDDDYE